MAVLDRILASKRSELDALRRRSLPAAPAHRPVFTRRAPGDALRLISEIKRKSPSAGELSTVLTARERASAYEKAGASMLSVLCDGPFFGGRYEDLLEAREGASIPLLCKEFIVDECQLDAARAFGASAALLIVRCLTPSELGRLIAAAHERELTPLVEITNDDEARVALDQGATWIGVNARDLDTLQMDSSRARSVLEALPPEVVRCHFSGVKTPADVQQVAASGADAALVGEVLMRQDDPTELLGSLAQAARTF